MKLNFSILNWLLIKQTKKKLDITKATWLHVFLNDKRNAYM